jgi:hypothetical protein
MDPHNFCGRLGEADYKFSDPGNGLYIRPPGNFQHCQVVTAAAETRKLGDPYFLGQWFTISMLTDGGDCVITADSPVNQTGNNTITLNDAKDAITLTSVADGAGGFEWRVVENNGTSLSTV